MKANGAQRAVLLVGTTAVCLPLWSLLGGTAEAALAVVVLWTAASFGVFVGHEQQDPWAG